jgi:hypothetical protein
MTIAELIARAGIRQADDDALLDLLAQVYEAGFAHGAEVSVAQIVHGPLERAELVELIALARRRRYAMLNSADYIDALTLEV